MVEHTVVPARRIPDLPVKLWIGAVAITIIILLAAFGPWIAPYRFDAIDIMARFNPPNLQHWFGTDDYGRDVLSRVLVGAHQSLIMGFGATAISLIIGISLGLYAGYRRGFPDEAVMRSMDVILSFPPILLGLLILAVTPPALWKAMIAVGIVYVPAMARLTRSVTLELSNEEYIEAARARGEKSSYILVREILPNAWPPIAVEGSLRVTFAILLGAALSFLGMGAQPPSAEWGLMISEGRTYLDQAPWIVLAPGFAMCLTVISINLVGDGLREILDPRLQRNRGS